MKFLINTLIILLCLIISGLLNTSFQTVIRLRSLQDKSACCCSEATICSCSCTGGCCSPVLTTVSFTDCDITEMVIIPSTSIKFLKTNLKSFHLFPNNLTYTNEKLLINSINFIFPIEKPPQTS